MDGDIFVRQTTEAIEVLHAAVQFAPWLPWAQLVVAVLIAGGVGYYARMFHEKQLRARCAS